MTPRDYARINYALNLFVPFCSVMIGVVLIAAGVR
jgi:hypothetical protein